METSDRRPMLHLPLYPTLAVVVGTVAGLLLTSIGGAGIAAAPITVPALWAVRRQCGRGGRIALGAILALTLAEYGWVVVYGFDLNRWVGYVAPVLGVAGSVGVLAYASRTPRPTAVRVGGAVMLAVALAGLLGASVSGIATDQPPVPSAHA